MYTPANTKAQFISNVFDSGSLDQSVILSMCESQCTEKDENWYDEASSFTFDDGSIVVVGPQSVEVEV